MYEKRSESLLERLDILWSDCATEYQYQGSNFTLYGIFSSKEIEFFSIC
jgi:hypothetical protein